MSILGNCLKASLYHSVFCKRVDDIDIQIQYNLKNQRAYLAIPVSDIKGLMKLKNVLSCFNPSYRSVQISPRFL